MNNFDQNNNLAQNIHPLELILVKNLDKPAMENSIVILALDSVLNSLRSKIITQKFSIIKAKKLGNKSNLENELITLRDTTLRLCFKTLETLDFSKDTEHLFNAFIHICNQLLINLENDILIKKYILRFKNLK